MRESSSLSYGKHGKPFHTNRFTHKRNEGTFRAVIGKASQSPSPSFLWPLPWFLGFFWRFRRNPLPNPAGLQSASCHDLRLSVQ
jgi:hypothetical protein